MNSQKRQKGLTLVEVAVAVAIMAVIYVLSNQAISVATGAFEVSERAGKRIEKIDRAWFFIKQDLRNFLAHSVRQPFGGDVPPLVIEFGQPVWLALLRSGNPNPLSLPRTEMQRVAYKFEDEIITRYTWQDPSQVDFELAREQRILDGVENIEIKVLPPTAKSIDGPWVDKWTDLVSVPLAVEVVMTLQDRGEMRRVFTLTNAK